MTKEQIPSIHPSNSNQEPIILKLQDLPIISSISRPVSSEEFMRLSGETPPEPDPNDPYYDLLLSH